jgi:serine/threonine protein kinase/TPR repeat protein
MQVSADAPGPIRDCQVEFSAGPLLRPFAQPGASVMLQETIEIVYATYYQYFMQGDGLPEDLDLGATIQIPRFGAGQRIFRRYTLQKIIGRGGMGVVWLAQDACLESLVALKVLPDTLLHDSASLDSLKRETKLGLSLAHPNIVRIYDFQNDEHAAAISMEYVDGGNLSDLRIKKPSKVLNPSDLMEWLEALFDGLDYAHNRQQIVHRDLKPRNLMLNNRGELKIADFGISRSISESMTLLSGMLASTGSPPYVSPQQWDGERPTPLDDIYSLGATLYELLTSKPPLLGVVDWQQVHHKLAPPLWQRRLDLGIKGADPIPAQWEKAIAACLAKDPKDRPQTVRELKGRLLIDSLQTVTLTDVPATRVDKRSPPLFPAPEDTPLIEGDFDDGSEKTIKGGTTLPIRSSEEPAPDDQGLFDEPTSRQIKDRPVTAQPSDDIETGATLQNRQAETTIRQDATVGRQKKIPVGLWLTFPAVVLLGALAYIVLRPGERVVPTPPAVVPTPPAVVPTPPAVIPTPAAVIPTPAAVIPTPPVVVSTPPVVVPTPAAVVPTPANVISTPPVVHGDLAIDSDPPGATITLDGDISVKAPHTFKGIEVGGHRLTATLDGYLPVQREVQFDGTTSSPIVLKLEQKPPPPEEFGKLSVLSNPSGASILLDGSPPDEPPSTFTKIPFGKHRLTATLDGYEPIYQELQIDTTNTVSKLLELKRTQQSLRLEELVDQVNKYRNAPDSPQYVAACVKYLQHLYLTKSPPAPELPPDELRQDLEKVIERVRDHQAKLIPSVSRQEFEKYKEAITYAAQFDVLQAILMLAENETAQHRKFSLFEKAASEKNDPYAMMMLGILYAKGAADIPGKPDLNKALDWLQRAAKAGKKEAAAYYYDAYLFVDTGTKRSEEDQKAAIERLEELAKQDIPHAKVVLGQWRRLQAVATKDKALSLRLYREAADWWRKAKGPGEWRACSYLGSLYETGLLNENGKPTQDDLNEAKALYREGAINEDVACMYNFGRLLWNQAKGGDQRKEAAQWVRRAADENYEPAKAWLKRNGI